MNLQHKNLAAKTWNKMSLVEQLANVGSEVERAISWRQKGNQEYSRKAYERALELLALTKNAHKKKSRLKEITRVYELLIDYFQGENNFGSTGKLWRKYFQNFTHLASLNRSD